MLRNNRAETYRLVKHSGQVFTPDFLVRNILDYAGYTDGNILGKHIIDNSCGDGAFLCEIATRYCKAFAGDITDLKQALETYIHGIEIDPIAYSNCLYNLNAVAADYGLQNVKWDILNANALTVTQYNGRMDYVVGNPPYVRVHNLEDDYAAVKTFNFAQDGMTDLYLVFYELGLRMLKQIGRLCYITPSSWLSSLAATNMRRHIMLYRKLVGLVDLGHYQAFENATTYTMIVLFDMQHKHNAIDYYTYSEALRDRVYIDTLTYEEISICDKFYVASRKDLALLRAIKTTPTYRFVQVKNGFATLADDVFIKDVCFEAMTIPILKASTGKWQRCFFPYDRNGKPLSKEVIFANAEIATYLEARKSTLLKKQTEKENPYWYLYGRTQALKDVYETKYSINAIVKDLTSIKLIPVPVGSGLYSGLYILTDVPYEILETIIKTEEFINYLRMLKNYKSGGYYTYNSKDLEQYLNYKIAQHEKSSYYIPAHECGLFAGYF